MFGNKEDKLNQKIIDGHAEISRLEALAAETSGGQSQRYTSKANNHAAYVAKLENQLAKLMEKRRG